MGFAGLAHGRELRRRGMVVVANQCVDSRGMQVFAFQRHQLVVLLSVGAERRVQRVFDTNPRQNALLHSYCRAVKQKRATLTQLGPFVKPKQGYEVLDKLYHSFKHINLGWLFGDPGSPLLTDTAEPIVPYQTQNKNKAASTTTSTAPDTNRLEEKLQEANEKIALFTSQLADKERIIQLLEKSSKSS